MIKEPKILAKIEFEAELVLEHTCTPIPTELGKHKHTMELYDNDGYLGIEWIYTDKDGDEGVTQIGITADYNKNVTDYDGVFSLPKEAIKLLHKAGFTTKEVEL